MYEDEGEQLIESYCRVHENGVITSLDMALPDPDSDSGRAPYADIFMPSAEEMLYMLERNRFMEWHRTKAN